MRRISDREWQNVYWKYFNEYFDRLTKENVSAKTAIAEAFQVTVDLEYHPYFPTLLPVNQQALGAWGEDFKKKMDEDIHIAIIDCDIVNPVVGILQIKREWLFCDLPQWLVDIGGYDYFYEIPYSEDELIEHLLFVYCGYSQSKLHWHVMPADTKFKQLTINNFQQ